MEAKNEPRLSEPSLCAGDAEARASVLRGMPSVVGVAWARARFDELKAEGRSMAGGWPGTVAEARALISARLSRELCERALMLPDFAEMSAATEATYGCARADWLRAVHAEGASLRLAARVKGGGPANSKQIGPKSARPLV